MYSPFDIENQSVIWTSGGFGKAPIVVVNMVAESTPYSAIVLLKDVNAVVFDKDGTLVDVQRTWGPAMVRTLDDLVGDLGDRERVAAAIGVDLTAGTLATNSPVIAESNAEIAARIAVELDRSMVETALQLEELVTVHVGDAVQALPGVGRLLSAMKDHGFWVGLATNDSGESAVKQLSKLGWRKYFDSVLGYDSGFGAKPNPGMLMASAQRAGCSMDRVLMVGDTATDVGAAKSAGCRAVVVGEHPCGISDVTAEITQISHLSDLLGI